MNKLRKYKVNDLRSVDGSSQIIFVLESPHTEEFAHGHPVAGQAGKRLAVLLGSVGLISKDESQFPLGCLIKSGKITNIAVMNASQIPLDKKFYRKMEAESEVIEILNNFKCRLQKKTQVSFQPNEKVENYLLCNFVARLKELVSKSTDVIIPLGHFASNFVKAAFVKDDDLSDYNVFYGVQHPSSRTWNNSKNVELLRNAMECISLRS